MVDTTPDGLCSAPPNFPSVTTYICSLMSALMGKLGFLGCDFQALVLSLQSSYQFGTGHRTIRLRLSALIGCRRASIEKEKTLLGSMYGDKAMKEPERTNETAGIYATGCAEVANELNLPCINLWSKMQETDGWPKKFLRLRWGKKTSKKNSRSCSRCLNYANILYIFQSLALHHGIQKRFTRRKRRLEVTQRRRLKVRQCQRRLFRSLFKLMLPINHVVHTEMIKLPWMGP